MSTNRASNKYALNTSWILIEKVSRIVSGILVGVLVARYLGPEQFGIISYALNLVAIFSILSTLGMDSIVVRELITRAEQKNTILGTAFMLRLMGSVLVVLGTTIFAYFRDSHQDTMIVFLVSLSVVLQSFTVIDLYFQARVRGKLSAINQVITLLVSSVVKIGLIYVHAPIAYFAGMVLFEAILSAINQCVFYRREGEPIVKWTFSWNEAKDILGHTWPLILSGLIMITYQKMDQILIKQWLDPNSLGNYAAAARISEASNFIPIAICAAIFPGIINLRDNKELQYKRLTQLYSVMIWSALVICIGGMLLGDFVITSFYKEKYNLAPGVFKIHVWNTLPVFFGCAWTMWILAENAQKILIYLQCALLAIALGLNFLLIPEYGIKGAAYALVATQFMVFVINLSIYKPATSWGIFLRALNPLNIKDILIYFKGSKV